MHPRTAERLSHRALALAASVLVCLGLHDAQHGGLR